MGRSNKRQRFEPVYDSDEDNHFVGNQDDFIDSDYEEVIDDDYEEVIEDDYEEVIDDEDELHHKKPTKFSIESDKSIDKAYLFKNISINIKTSLRESLVQYKKFTDHNSKANEADNKLEEAIQELTRWSNLTTPLFDLLVKEIGDDLLQLLKHPNLNIVKLTLLFFYGIIDVEHEKYQKSLIQWFKENNFLSLILELSISFRKEESALEEDYGEENAGIELFIIESLLDYSDEYRKAILNDVKFVRTFEKILSDLYQDRNSNVILEEISDEKYMELFHKLITIDTKEYLTKYPSSATILVNYWKALDVYYTKINKDDDELPTENLCIDATALNLKVIFSQPKGIEILFESGEIKSLLDSFFENPVKEVFYKRRFKNYDVFIQLLNLTFEFGIDLAKKSELATKLIANDKYLKYLLPDDLAHYRELELNLENIKLLNNSLRYSTEGLFYGITGKNWAQLTKLEEKYSKRVKFSYDYDDDDYSQRLNKGLNIIQEISIFKSWFALRKSEDLTKFVKKNKGFDPKRIKEVINGLKTELEVNLKLLEEGSIPSDDLELSTSSIKDQLGNLNKLIKSLGG